MDHFGVTELLVAVGGLGIGILGTLIGAGGGFLIVPLLVLFEPSWGTDQVTAGPQGDWVAEAPLGQGRSRW